MEEKIKKYKQRISKSDKKELEKIKNEIQNDDKLEHELSSCIMMMNLIKDGNQNFKKLYPDNLSEYNLIENFLFLIF